MGIIGFIIPAFADTQLNFEYTVMPEKILENTDGVIQIYADDGTQIFPQKIKSLVALSSDSEIIEVIEIVTNDNSFITELKIKANKPGTVNIALAAPGFVAKEPGRGCSGSS